MATAVSIGQLDKKDRLTMAYVLWLLGFMGVAGLHRLYNGKIVTGVLWLCTGGLFGVGQIVDLFLVPGMTEEHQLKMMLKSGYTTAGVPTSPVMPVETIVQPTREQLQIKLLKAAQQHGGRLTVTQAVLATEIGFLEAQSLLNDMVRAGYVSIDNHPETGVLMYDFHEL